MNRMQKYQASKKKTAKETEAELVVLDTTLKQELDSNPKYALTVDPTNAYNISDAQKAFIKYYCEYFDVQVAAQLAGIDMDIAIEYFKSEVTEKEIRRINQARYLRRFSQKCLSIDQLAGWLSSLITDENVPIADRLKTKDKMSAASMLISLLNEKRNAYDNPDTIMNKNIEEQLHDLSLDAIQQLIAASNNSSDKQKLQAIEQIKQKQPLTPEEVAFLKTLSVDELLNLLNKAKT